MVTTAAVRTGSPGGNLAVPPVATSPVPGSDSSLTKVSEMRRID